MATNFRRQTVAGIFEDEASARTAVAKLVEAQFDVEADVRVIVSKERDRQTIPILSEVPVTRTALIGAAVGAVLGAGAALVTGLDSGPVSMVEWGMAFAAFESAFAIGSVGMVIGVIWSFELAEPVPAFHLARFHDGIVWVGVQAGGIRAERARNVLEEAGARHFMDRQPEVAAA